MKRRRSSGGSFARRVRPYAGAALRLGVRAYKSWTRNNRRKRGTAGVGVSTHYDVKTIYRRKRMPRRKRQAWKKFVRKVHAVNLKDLGTKTVVRNESNFVTSSTGGQAVFACCLYGVDGSNLMGTSSMGTDDLKELVNTASYTPNQKIHFKSAVLDMTVTNTGNEGSNGVLTEVDVYRYVFRKHCGSTSVLQAFTDGFASQTTIGTGSALSIATRGVTPFQCPEWCSYIKVLSKKKYFLSNGTAFTFQIRDPKNRIWDCGETADFAGLQGKVGWTQGALVIFKAVPQLSGPAPTSTLVMGCTRTYSYVVDESSTAEDAFIP